MFTNFTFFLHFAYGSKQFQGLHPFLCKHDFTNNLNFTSCMLTFRRRPFCIILPSFPNLRIFGVAENAHLPNFSQNAHFSATPKTRIAARKTGSKTGSVIRCPYILPLHNFYFYAVRFHAFCTNEINCSAPRSSSFTTFY